MVTGVLIRRGGHTVTQREGRGEKPGVTNSQRGEIFPRGFRGRAALPDIVTRLVSRAVRAHISVVAGQPACGNILKQS